MHITWLTTVVTICCSLSLGSGRSSAAPSSLVTSTPSNELGSVLLLLMPDPGARFVGWDHRANSQIYWIDRGYVGSPRKDGRIETQRRGLLRVNVLGKSATRLVRRKEELLWTIRYSTLSSPKHGVDFIEIFPGLPDSICFGDLDDGCEFDLLKSAKSVGIAVREICKSSQTGGTTIGYVLSHPGRTRTVAAQETSYGSGGITTQIRIFLSEVTENICGTT